MTCRPPSLLRPGDVHVWWIDLTPVTDASLVLAPDEQTRADRIRLSPERERWIVARAAQRQLLSQYAGLAPRELPLEIGPQGKPALAGGSPYRFSFTHAGDRAALAIAWRCEVGIDLEPADPDWPGRANLDQLIARVCSAEEISRLQAMPVEDRMEAFLQLWTLKEAYLKGIGAGLGQEPRDLEFDVFENGRALIHQGRAQPRGSADPSADWTLRLIDAGDGWIAALAVATAELEIVHFTWPEASIGRGEVGPPGLRQTHRSRI
jgi:4'-phosphopantetheinyl transferase